MKIYNLKGGLLSGGLTKPHQVKSLKQNDFAYGTGIDCVEFNNNDGIYSRIISVININLIRLKVFFMSQEQLEKIIPNSSNYSKKELAKLMAFEEQMVKKYFDETFGDKPLFLGLITFMLNSNSNRLPMSKSTQLKDVMKEFREWMIKGHSILEDEKSEAEKQKTKVELNKIVDKRIPSFVEVIPSYYKNNTIKFIKDFLESNEINEEDALDCLDNFDNIVGVKFYADLFKQYFNSHRGYVERPRKLDGNDYFVYCSPLRTKYS